MASATIVSRPLIRRFHIDKQITRFSPPAGVLPAFPTAVCRPNQFLISLRNPRISAKSTSYLCPITLSPTLSPDSSLNPTPLTGSTRTVTTLLAVALAFSKFFASKVFSLTSDSGFRRVLISTAGPAFFAAAREQTTRTLNTPFTVIAAGMAKWLDIYSGVLMVRVLLSWFPNIPWDKQPLSAIRDLCDPYLNLFRNIIPPIFDTLDVSPLLAFAVLGALASILNSSRGGY